MKSKNKGKSIAVLALFLAIVVLLGYFASLVVRDTLKDGKNGLKLGLDLAGGASIVYQIEGDATKEQIQDTIMKLQ
jgi:SecD/SecF fusion protein